MSAVPHTHKYVALLRGINVGAANRITMVDLRAVFEALGHTGVTTLLQSGNVVFDSPRVLGAAAVIALEDELANRSGIRCRILVLPAERFQAVLAANPLLEEADDPSLMVVTFLETAPPADLKVPTDLGAEKLVIGTDAVYQWCPLGVSKSKVPVSFFRALGPAATARNLRTVGKIQALIG